jgi:hypothetical protein
MNKIYALLYIVLLIISILGLVLPPRSEAQAQYFLLAGVSWGSEASPGDLSAPLTISIQYIGTTNLNSMTGILYLPSGFKSSDGGVVATAYSGPSPAGSIIPLTFYISIDPSTPIGNYRAALHIIGRTIYGAVLEHDFNVSIDLRGKADLVFDASPRILRPGDINEISIRAYNRGTGPAYNLTLSYSVQGSGSVISLPLSIDILPARMYYDTRIQVYVPPSASSQPLILSIAATYLNPYYMQKTYSQTLGFYVGQLQQTVISISPVSPNVVAGTVNHLVLKVANLGTARISSMVISIAAPQQTALILGDGRFYISSLEAGEARNITLTLYISPQAPQILYLQAQASYIDSWGTQRSDSIAIGLSIDYQPGYFQAVNSFWGTPGQIIQVGPGDSGVPLTITVRYIGNSTIYNVNFTLVAPNGIEILPSLQSVSQYISSLQPNSVLQLTYQVSIGSSLSTGSYKFYLLITWDTQSRSGYSQALPLSIDIKGRADLYITPLTPSPEPGSINLLRLLITNNGTGSATQIAISSIQAPSISILDYQPRQFSLPPGGSSIINITAYIPPALQQSPLVLSLSLTYVDPYGYQRSYTQQVGLYTGAQKMPLIIIDTLDKTLVPGYINNISIRVTNMGAADIYNISVGLSTQAPGAASITPSQLISQLRGGGSASLSYQVYVPSNLAGSTLSISVTISYVDQYGVAKVQTQLLGFYVSESQQSMLTFNISSNIIQPGFNNISIILTNNGVSGLYNITLQITPPQSIALVNSDGRFYIPSLGSGEKWYSSISLYMSRSSALPQQTYSTTSMGITLTYYDQTGALRSESRSIYLIISIPPLVSPIDIEMEPQILVAGKINNATVYIRNKGSQAIDNLVISLSTMGGQISLIGRTNIQIQRLLQGSSIEIPLQIYVPPAASPSATIQTDLKYYIEGSLFQEVRSIGVVSRGIIDLKVTDFAIIPERPSPGQIFSITVTLTNQGTITASAVTATPLQTQDIRIFGSRSVFIGDMQVNSPSTFTVTLITSNTTRPGRYEVPIQISYYDNLRTLYTINISIPIIIGGFQQAITRTPALEQGPGFGFLNSQLIYYLVIAAVAFAIGIYVGRRR